MVELVVFLIDLVKASSNSKVGIVKITTGIDVASLQTLCYRFPTNQESRNYYTIQNQDSINFRSLTQTLHPTNSNTSIISEQSAVEENN